MLRVFVTAILLSGIPSLLPAQDKLVKKNGDTLEVNVLAVGLGSIKYLLAGDEKASVFEVSKRKFSGIVFENGKRHSLVDNSGLP
jgi:nucleoid-associated protein YgaU